MHNLLLLSRFFTTRCAALLAAWWLAALVSGLWGWGTWFPAESASHKTFASLSALRQNVAPQPAQGVVCPMTGKAKCCCKTHAPIAPAFPRACLTARCGCGDESDSGANLPLASGTWHAPVYFAAVPVFNRPYLIRRAIFGFACEQILSGRSPAPLSPPPLFSFNPA